MTNTLLEWLDAENGTSLLVALSESRFATNSMEDTETGTHVRLLFNWSPLSYVLSKTWAENVASSLEGFDSPPPTSAAGQWRSSYRPFFVSLDCPGNRILDLYVYDSKSKSVRWLNFDEGYTSELLGTLDDFLNVLKGSDDQGIFLGEGEFTDEGESYEREETMLKRGRAAFEFNWREI